MRPVFEDKAEIKVPADEREHAPVSKGDPSDLSYLSFAELQELRPREIKDDLAAGRRSDLASQLERGIKAGFVLDERQMLRLDLDTEVNQARARWAGQHVDDAGVRQVVEHVLGLDGPPRRPRRVDVAGVDAPVRRLVDVRQQKITIHRCVGIVGRRVGAPVGAKGDGRVGEVGEKYPAGGNRPRVDRPR